MLETRDRWIKGNRKIKATKKCYTSIEKLYWRGILFVAIIFCERWLLVEVRFYRRNISMQPSYYIGAKTIFTTIYTKGNCIAQTVCAKWLSWLLVAFFWTGFILLFRCERFCVLCTNIKCTQAPSQAKSSYTNRIVEANAGNVCWFSSKA